jgi:hypothetical protein
MMVISLGGHSQIPQKLQKVALGKKVSAKNCVNNLNLEATVVAGHTHEPVGKKGEGRGGEGRGEGQHCAAAGHGSLNQHEQQGELVEQV